MQTALKGSQFLFSWYIWLLKKLKWYHDLLGLAVSHLFISIFFIEKRCAKPSEVTNGVVTCLNPDYEYQSICFVSCNKGFDLEGAVVMQCNADQTWDMAGLLPQCIGNNHLSHLVDNPTMWFTNRSDTNRPVQLQKQARSLKFRS